MLLKLDEPSAKSVEQSGRKAASLALICAEVPELYVPPGVVITPSCNAFAMHDAIREALVLERSAYCDFSASTIMVVAMLQPNMMHWVDKCQAVVCGCFPRGCVPAAVGGCHDILNVFRRAPTRKTAFIRRVAPWALEPWRALGNTRA